MALRAILTFVVLAVSLSTPAASRSQGMQLIEPGPLARPLMVRDEGGNWAIPISVYSDRNLELLVSENLTLAGVTWDEPAFKKYGTYSTYVYSFYKTDRDCVSHRIPVEHVTDPKWLAACAELRYNRRLVLVDTRKKIITVQQTILMESDGQPHPDLMSFPNVTMPLNDSVNPSLFHAVMRITTMIEQEIGKHPEL